MRVPGEVQVNIELNVVIDRAPGKHLKFHQSA